MDRPRSAPPPDAVARAIAAFRESFDADPTSVVRAPGRVNLIGEHTDYNAGFALPMALPQVTAIAARATDDRRVSLRSEGFGVATCPLDDDPGAAPTWARYVHAMLQALERAGHPVAGFDATITTDLPTGASLSSSAALEVATGLTVAALTGASIDVLALARAGRTVEHEGFDLPGGMLDQIASAAATAGSALLLDCRDHTWRPVPLPADVAVVVLDTGTRRRLTETAYADRQRACREAADRLGVTALRDAVLDDLDRLPAPLRPRARHVISENARTLEAADAFAAGDAATAGRLMTESHRSLRDDYEVSGPALDAVVAAALAHPSCLGARMTGGGFAGGAVALVEAEAAPAFVDHLTTTFRLPESQPAEATPTFRVVGPSEGASILRPAPRRPLSRRPTAGPARDGAG